MSQPLVLYVEDEQSDSFFMRLAFGEQAEGARLHTLTDGQQALDYFNGKEPYDDRRMFPLPDLVLLDLKLPIRSGFSLLQWLRRQPQFQALPVVVFSSSPDLQDRDRVLQMGANQYLTKPNSGLHFVEVVQNLVKRWLPTA